MDMAKSHSLWRTLHKASAPCSHNNKHKANQVQYCAWKDSHARIKIACIVVTLTTFENFAGLAFVAQAGFHFYYKSLIFVTFCIIIKMCYLAQRFTWTKFLVTLFSHTQTLQTNHHETPLPFHFRSQSQDWETCFKSGHIPPPRNLFSVG